jgi:hypothetical protein
MKKAGEVKICKYCVRPFEPNISFQMYCSSECQKWDARRRKFIKWKDSGKWGLENITWEEYLKASVERSKEMSKAADFFRALTAAVKKDNHKTPYKEIYLKIRSSFYGQ